MSLRSRDVSSMEQKGPGVVPSHPVPAGHGPPPGRTSTMTDRTVRTSCSPTTRARTGATSSPARRFPDRPEEFTAVLLEFLGEL